jgi:glycosyltransferase involved in cell wall biosynthesis
MDESPLVSVVIPTYKRPAECVRAVRSVLLQTFQDFEIIVGNDYGQDETATLLEELEDARIHYLDHKGKGGSACLNRNLCLEHVRGKYVTFLDSDDLILPDKLEKQVAAFEAVDDSIGFVISGTRVVRVIQNEYYFSHDLVPTAEGDLREAYFARRLKCYNTSLMVRRDVLVAVGNWDHHMEPYDDAELIFRLMSYTQAARVREIVTVWFDHDGECLTNDLVKRMTGLEAFMTKHAEVLELHPLWWNPRVEELLKWFFLASNLDGFLRWAPRLHGFASRETKFLKLFTCSRWMFRFGRLVLAMGRWGRNVMTKRSRSQRLVDLIPENHRAALVSILSD